MSRYVEKAMTTLSTLSPAELPHTHKTHGWFQGSWFAKSNNPLHGVRQEQHTV